jgi:hypothetical protein
MRRRVWLLAWVVVHIGVAVILVRRMPADAWFVSDPGAKYIAVQNLLEHPARPFEIDLAPIPDQFARTMRPHLFELHGDHAHAVTSQVFPLLSAPFVKWLGPVGLTALPLIGWVLIGPLTARLAAILGARAPGWLVIVTAAAATPFVFYGLEGWEHVPAIALVLAAAVAVLSPTGSMMGDLLGGLCAAMAVQLRPETAAVVLAVAIIALLRHRSATHLVAAGAGLAIGMLPLAFYNYAHFGTPASPHLAANLGHLSAGWWQERLAYFTHWFVPSRRYMALAFGVFALGWLLARFTRWRAVGFSVCCFIAIGLAFEEARRHEVLENFFRAFPIGLLAFLPLASPSPARRDLWIWCGVTFAGSLLASPNDGGGQWGPRYLQPMVPALLCLGLDGLASAPMRRVAWATGAWVIAAGLVVSSQAIHELREAKLVSQRLVHRTAADAQGVSFVVSDVWWLATYHAAAIDYRRMLFVDSPAAAAPLIDALAPADLLLVTTPSATDAEVRDWSFARCAVVDRLAPGPDDPVRRVRIACR